MPVSEASPAGFLILALEELTISLAHDRKMLTVSSGGPGEPMCLPPIDFEAEPMAAHQRLLDDLRCVVLADTLPGDTVSLNQLVDSLLRRIVGVKLPVTDKLTGEEVPKLVAELLERLRDRLPVDSDACAQVQRGLSWLVSRNVQL